MTNDTETNRILLRNEFRRILLVRNALQAAGLCGADDDPENNGREAAFAVIQALQRQHVVVHVPSPPEPEHLELVPPTLGERITSGAISLTSRAAAAASKRSSWSLMRLRRSSRSQS